MKQLITTEATSDADFAQAQAIQVADAGGLSVVSREQSEIQSAIISAKRFPRSEEKAFAQIIKAFKRPSLARCAQYSFPRGGATVRGPSIDTARELARLWGNIKHGLRIVGVDDIYVHIKGYAIDLENNASIEAEDKFKKLVQRKRGGNTQWVAPDERDLRELINRRGAILVRNCILQLIAPDIVDAALEQADATLRQVSSGELEQSREDTIRSLVLIFDGMGVSVEMLEQRLKHELSLITVSELTELRTIYKSLRDGNSRREDHFGFGEPSPQSPEKLLKLNASLGLNETINQQTGEIE